MPRELIIRANKLLNRIYGRASEEPIDIMQSIAGYSISKFPSAGLELSATKQTGNLNKETSNSGNTKLIQFLKSHKTNEKYILVVASTNGYASDIIIKSGEAVMPLGGFFGTDNVINLKQFKTLVAIGKVRYVMAGGNGMGGGSSSDIMKWASENGKVVATSEWMDSTQTNVQTSDKVSNNIKPLNSQNVQSGEFGGGDSEVLYDLKAYTDSSKK